MNDVLMPSDGIFGFSVFRIRIAILSRLKWERKRKCVSSIRTVDSLYVPTYAYFVREVNMKMTYLFRISSAINKIDDHGYRKGNFETLMPFRGRENDYRTEGRE